MLFPRVLRRTRAPRGTVTLLVTGLAAGFASGLLGIGGGLIVVPVLIAAFGLPVKSAAPRERELR